MEMLLVSFQASYFSLFGPTAMEKHSQLANGNCEPASATVGGVR